MTKPTTDPVLLPSGLYDLLPPYAEAESTLVSGLLAFFRQYGYDQVQPPLMEFEETLNPERNSTLAKQSLRVMDPLSQSTLAVRADMTMQIARIAGISLAQQPRPLRLCYAGQTLRTLPDTIRQQRQFRQIGIELFGPDAVEADVEVIQLACQALHQQGIQALSIDLSLPTLLSYLLDGTDANQQEAIMQAVRLKDHSFMKRHKLIAFDVLLSTQGNVDALRSAYKKLKLHKEANALVERLLKAAELLQQHVGSAIRISADVLDMSGFGYHWGLSASIYSPHSSQALGRGGRYRTHWGEPATGFTFYADDIVSLLPDNVQAPRLLVPKTCNAGEIEPFQAEGYRTIYALTNDLKNESQASGIEYYLDKNQPVKVS